MITSIIAIIAIAGVSAILSAFDKSKHTFGALILIFVSWYLIISTPSGEYSEWKTQSNLKLLQLSEEDIQYLKESEEEFTFRYIWESEFKQEEILESINKDENTIIETIYINENQEPFLLIFNREGISSKWTFEKMPTQTKYVFYIPEKKKNNENQSN